MEPELFTYGLNLFCDFVVCVLVEAFTRQVFPGKGCPKAILLSSQLLFLLVLCAITLLHHIPYLLLLFAFGVSVRVCFMFISNRQIKKNEFVSKRLHNATSKTNGTLTPIQSYHHATNHNWVSSQRIPDYASHPQPLAGRQNTKPGQVGVNTLNRQSLSGFRTRAPSNNPPVTVKQATPFTFLPKLPTVRNYLGSMFDFKQTSSRSSGPPGLLNSGNTCFVNSILQCLIWTPGFVDSLKLIDFSGSGNEPITRELVKVLYAVLQFQSEECSQVVNVSELLMRISSLAPHLLANRGSASFQSQQDSAEFLLWLLNFIHTELGTSTDSSSTENTAAFENAKRACATDLNQIKSTDPNLNSKLLTYSDIEWSVHAMKSKSVVYEQFLGQLLEARECQLCNKLSLNIEYFMVLPLPVPTSTHSHQVFTLNDCFELFSKTEQLIHPNMITCSCIVPTEQTFTPGQRRSLVSKAPKNLIIQLSRYTYKTSLQTTVKNKVCVQFQTLFTLPSSTWIQSELGSTPQESISYRLVGVCVHSGAENTSYGHYVAYCKTSVGWRYFNDDTVKSVLDIQEELNEYFLLQNAYLLFYSQTG